MRTADDGRLIYLKLIEDQLVGGSVLGFGGALHEEFGGDERVTLTDYLLPGIKGVGEAALPGLSLRSNTWSASPLGVTRLPGATAADEGAIPRDGGMSPPRCRWGTKEG